MSLEEHGNHSDNDTDWYLHDCTFHLDKDARRITLFLLYLVVFVVGLLENALVVWVNWRRRHAAGGVLFCVINVSLSDLMMVLVLPFFMMEVTVGDVWLWGHFLCKVTNLVYMLNFYSSSFFLALMTLERYLSLTRPHAACFPAADRRRRWLLCGGLWLFSFLLALLENVHVDLVEWDDPGCYLMPEHNHTEWFNLFFFLNLACQFLGPAAVIVTFNVLIARAVRSAPDVQQSEVRLVHVYSLVFVACWLPYHLVVTLLMISYVNPYADHYSCRTMDALYFLYGLTQNLSLFHCVANPVLYNFLSKGFRRDLTDAVMSCIPREALMGPAAAGTRPNAADTAGGKEDGRLSDMSTSHSDVGS